MFRLFAHANYDFLAMRRRAYAFSASVLLIGIGFAIYWHATTGSWLKYGVDFTGGTLMRVQMIAPADEGDLRELIGTRIDGTEVVRSQDEFMIRTPTGEGEATTTADIVRGALTERYGPEGTGYVVRGIDAVGAKVGGELQQKAIVAILISFAFVLLYLAIRYEWRFSLAAVLATVHDVVLTLCIIIIFRLDVSLDAVAAMLTILGYSLNDTVIIFDRIREHLKGKKVPGELSGILNLSINETLPRTTLTVATTLATLFSLFLLGGEIIRIFATIMIVGILLGAYSSIFVASPALRAIEKRWPRPTATTARKSRTSSSSSASAKAKA